MGFVRDPNDPLYRQFVQKLDNRKHQTARTRVPSATGNGERVRATGNDRDILIRTIIGEAANESELGQAAVAHNIINRTRDSRFPDTIKKVALQKNQYSAWNAAGAPTGAAKAGGNSLPLKYNPGDRQYDKVAAVVDRVLAGEIADPTGGSTHYYAPSGMKGGQAPRWWGNVTKQAGGNVVKIGGHRFSGKSNGRGGQVKIQPSAGADYSAADAATTPDAFVAAENFRVGEAARIARETRERDAKTNSNDTYAETGETDSPNTQDEQVQASGDNLFEMFQAASVSAGNPAFSRLVQAQHADIGSKVRSEL